MCLRKVGIKKVADNDIICYKSLRLIDGEMRTPCIYMKVTPKQKVFSAVLLQNDNADIGSTIINTGLHSYATLKDAIGDVGLYKNNVEIYISECIIPRGAVYYEGLYLNSKSYASNVLIYGDFVPISKYVNH